MRLKIDVTQLTNLEVDILRERGATVTPREYRIDHVELEGTRQALPGDVRLAQFFEISLDDGTKILEINVKALDLSVLIVDIDLKRWDASPMEAVELEAGEAQR